ncbi:MAG TPA: DegQ family serine endoprotease [Usitatibacter sp.]|jgi:serine protease Do|nr:DegQ family serine endoprotease [Usitatibacter sp.]
MSNRILVGALVAAGVIGTGAAAYRGAIDLPLAQAHAAPAAVAAPAANPGATMLPLNGFTEIVKKAGPAVVNVSVNGTRKAGVELPGVPEEFREFFRGFGGKNMPNFPNMPRGDAPTRGLGSGFIVSPDGYILTNAHVVEGADTVNVRLTDRREFRAKVVGLDKQTDVAVLKIDAKSLPTVRLGKSSEANVGEWVVAIGSPYGFDNTVTAGIVSAKSRSLPDSNYTPFIQTDVAVNPGNSGGPLFNLAGEVIGINSQIYSRSGGFQGISFAIPIEVALNVKDQLIKHGKVTRGRLGVTVQDVNATLAESFGLDRPRGALVSSVDSGSPAEKGGLQVGDIVLKYNGAAIERSSDLPMLVADTAPGKTASVQVWRKGGEKTLTVATYEGKAKGDEVASADGAATGGRLGLAVRPLTADERKENRGRAGLLVEEAAGAAARAGIQSGDVILSFNGNDVKTVEELRNLVAKAGKRVAILVQREGQQLFVPVELG